MRALALMRPSVDGSRCATRGDDPTSADNLWGDRQRRVASRGLFWTGRSGLAQHGPALMPRQWVRLERLVSWLRRSEVKNVPNSGKSLRLRAGTGHTEALALPRCCPV